MDVVGHHHSGIDDCNTIVNIIRAMQNKGKWEVSEYLKINDDVDPMNVGIKNFNQYFTEEDLTYDKLIEILDLGSYKVLLICKMDWYAENTEIFNYLVVVEDFNAIQTFFRRNNVYGLYTYPNMVDLLVFITKRDIMKILSNTKFFLY